MSAPPRTLRGLLLCGLLLSGVGPVAAHDTDPPREISQGHIVLLRIPDLPPGILPEVTWRGQPLPVFVDGDRPAVLVAADMDEPLGPAPLTLRALGPEGTTMERQWTIRVRSGRFPVQHLTLPREFVDLDPDALRRVEQEAAALHALWGIITPEKLWRGAFLSPLEGDHTPSGFGVRRIINGQRRSPHSGADFAAPVGTPVRASNAGRTVLVADHFFGGRSVVIDHGMGLYTEYLHLHESRVAEGEQVEKGHVIGLVGATGRATGPHLHWGAQYGKARINPTLLLTLPPAP